MDDDLELGQDNENELDDLGESGDDNPAPLATDNADSEPESKRIRDLTSKWQQEQARANRLQALLDANSGNADQGPKSRRQSKAKEDPLAEFRQFAIDDARQRLFNSEPRFAKYGIEADSIRGESIQEMQASFNQQRKVVEAMESRIRNEVLQEHGIDAGIGGGGSAEKLPDFGSMDQKAFEDLMARRSQF